MSQYAAAAVDPSSNVDAAGQLPSAQHKRVYQACIPCRRRKVRCDLGSVDNPHDPPCVRCRRESKECFFSATRRKRKTDDGDEEDLEEYVRRNGRKRQNEGSPSVAFERPEYRDVPLTPGGSSGRAQPLRRPAEQDSLNSGIPGQKEDPNTQVENLEAQSVMRREMYGPHDALDLLYKAATDNTSNQISHERANSATTIQPSPHQETIRKPPPPQERHFGNRRQPPKAEQPIDPQLLREQNEQVPDVEKALELTNEDGYDEAVKAWQRFRFVRAGWFTAEEAIKYIAYYYTYLSPMTPVSPPAFRYPATHLILLTEEPILTVTLLTIASRYYQIPGPGGHCRSHAIHEELWRYLRGMIERCLWGQEAFGGGFCGSGADESQTSSTAPWRGLRKGSLRTLGTIESLMILTEWHPRALHFPPSEAIDELMLPSFDPRDYINAGSDTASKAGGSNGGKRIESWLEPAWRSDRMCWMLLSTGMGLAYELGVFDDIDEMLAADGITRPEYEEESYRARAMRIKRLLLVYLTQLAGRLGWTNMVPESIRTSDPAFQKKRPGTNDATTPGTNPSSMSNGFLYVPDVELDDQVIHCWVGISNAMHVGNQKLFVSRKHTTEIISSGHYTKLLQEFQPILRDWYRDFDQCRMPQFIRHILTIEYEYVRIYINSLSLQAVVERCTNQVSHTANGVPNHNLQQLSPQTQNYLGTLPLGHLGGFGVEDQEYVREVVEGSRNLLRTVVDGLLPHGYLKHAPVRTYFRIISGAMFLLKTFALGAPKADVELSIGLMDRTVDALRNCVVDDVHLGKRFADLLESLTTRLRGRFISAPLNSGTAKSPMASGDAAAGVTSNGPTQSAGLDNGFLNPAVRGRDGLGVPDRSATPTINATPFDNISIGQFPLPQGSTSLFGISTPAPSGPDHLAGLPDSLFDSNDWTNPENPMMYLPAGAGLFQNVGESSNVTMTDQGINVGGFDLLEYMMDPQFPIDGTGF